MSKSFQDNTESDPIKLIKAVSLVKFSQGDPRIRIGLIDGPVNLSHKAFERSRIRTVNDLQSIACNSATSVACRHGTFIAGILCAKRGLSFSSLCPGCEILLRPIFDEDDNESGVPTTEPKELANAIFETANAGANIINLSVGIETTSISRYKELEEACRYCCEKNAIIIAASGNQGRIGYLPLNHDWVIPVVACNMQGIPTPDSNLSISIGRRGLMAPGSNITSLSPTGDYTTSNGTSVATAFVTGIVALLWSIFPSASAADIRNSILIASRRSIIPPILNAEQALGFLRKIY